MQDIKPQKNKKRSSTVLRRHSKTAFIYIKYYKRRSGYSFLIQKSKAVCKMQDFYPHVINLNDLKYSVWGENEELHMHFEIITKVVLHLL